jgi:ketosteroid isomerase-like protein
LIQITVAHVGGSSEDEAMTIQAGAEQVIREWLHRLWTDRDPSVIDELFVPDGQATGLNKELVIGPQEFHGFYNLMSSAITETQAEILHLMTHGADVMLLGHFRGCHQASGKQVAIHFAFHARVVGGKIVEATNVLDLFNLLQQIGYIEADALPKALASSG